MTGTHWAGEGFRLQKNVMPVAFTHFSFTLSDNLLEAIS
jgi:hypothetical protein